MQRFISGERDFIKRQLGVSVPLSLAVLDTKQWKLAERQLPYPMPSVSGEPPVALMPADWAGGPDFFPKQKDSDPAMVKAVLARGAAAVLRCATNFAGCDGRRAAPSTAGVAR